MVCWSIIPLWSRFVYMSVISRKILIGINSYIFAHCEPCVFLFTEKNSVGVIRSTTIWHSYIFLRPNFAPVQSKTWRVVWILAGVTYLRNFDRDYCSHQVPQFFLQSWRACCLNSAKGKSINYVDRILRIFDPSPLRWHVY